MLERANAPMPNVRTTIFWTIMLCYAAAILTCTVAFVRGWKAGHPFTGPKSAAYLSPFTNIFLGLGFIVSGASDLPGPWLRVAYVAAGIFQVLPAWNIWKRRRMLRNSLLIP